MHMHAGAGPRRIGLGHEGGGQPMLFGNRLDQALQHDGFVAGFQHIGAVTQHDFHLPWRIFRNQRLGGQALRVTAGIEVLEERREIVEVLEIISLVMLRPEFIDLRFRRHGLAGQRRGAIHQIEFEFDGADRCHVEIGLEAADDFFQHTARIEVVRRAVKVRHRGQILRGGFIRPRNIDQASGYRPQQHVAVTLVEDQAGFGNVLSGDVENHCRNRHEAAVPPGGDQLVAA